MMKTTEIMELADQWMFMRLHPSQTWSDVEIARNRLKAAIEELATLKNQEPIGYAMKDISTECKSSCDTCKYTWGNPGTPGGIAANPGDCYMFYIKPHGVCTKWASWLRDDDDDEVSTPACHATGAKEKTE